MTLAGPTLGSRSDLHSLQRFTLDGSDALENHLAVLCEQVLSGCQRIIPKHRLEGIVLGGGYGRGEGGVLKTSSGDQPYNDLEFYVFVRGHPWLNERRYRKALHRLSLELTPAAGIELEFKVTSLQTLRRSPPSLFYHDLLMGHRWILGDDLLFAGCEHHLHANRLPISEATRLLMNRCSGLLFARERLEQEVFTNEDADFVHRNLAKTELALGDALLIAFGEYHWSCLERGRRLDALCPAAELPWLAEVKSRHRMGIEFKLHPSKPRPSRSALQKRFNAVSSIAREVWLWLENMRLGGHFQSLGDCLPHPADKWPGANRAPNWLANLKVFGPRALLSPRRNRHPRERILSGLALLLWARFQVGPNCERQIRRELLLPSRVALISAYRERWSCVC